MVTASGTQAVASRSGGRGNGAGLYAEGMLVSPRLAPGIADGSITLLFRRWRRLQVVAGHRYRTAAGMIRVDAVDAVEPAAISEADAARAGYGSAGDLVADLRGPDTATTYRLAISPVPGPDPRDVLAASDHLTPDVVEQIDSRLDRLDRASSYGPWTAATLAVIAERPAVRAADLAAAFGRETQPFKLDVRKLKALGLTQSLEVGYRLSPRGTAYLRETKRTTS